MTDLYGRQWEASYGSVGGDVFKTWAASLASLTPQNVKVGLEELIKEGSDYPPNLIKFMRLCRTVTIQAHKPFAPLPPPIKKDPRAKQACLKAAREIGVLPNKERI